MKKTEVKQAKAPELSPEMKALIDAAQEARFALGGTGQPEHDRLVAALHPFLKKEK